MLKSVLCSPLPPLEASGTCGMKARFNGVPSLSVADGSWIYRRIDNVTGWSVSGDASLYDNYENVVLRLFTLTAAPLGLRSYAQCTGKLRAGQLPPGPLRSDLTGSIDRESR